MQVLEILYRAPSGDADVIAVDGWFVTLGAEVTDAFGQTSRQASPPLSVPNALLLLGDEAQQLDDLVSEMIALVAAGPSVPEEPA